MTRNVFMDFTNDRVISFKIHDQDFVVYSDVPLIALSNVMWAGIEQDEPSTREGMMNQVLDAICMCLHEESAVRFREVATKGEYIGINGLMNIQSWLMEVLSGRPLEESENSSGLSDDTGESLTDGHSEEASI